MRLYRSTNYPERWYAYSASTGWVMFPNTADGWTKRQAARGIDPIDVREVPVQQAFAAGIPGSPTASVEQPAAEFNMAEAA
jgi:hypothetical protein